MHCVSKCKCVKLIGLAFPTIPFHNRTILLLSLLVDTKNTNVRDVQTTETNDSCHSCQHFSVVGINMQSSQARCHSPCWKQMFPLVFGSGGGNEAYCVHNALNFIFIHHISSLPVTTTFLFLRIGHGKCLFVAMCLASFATANLRKKLNCWNTCYFIGASFE